MGTHTGRLMGRVAARQRLAALGRSFHAFLLCAAVAYGLALLASRLLGVIPDYARLVQVPALAVIALAAALAFHRRPTPRTTARLIDRQADTDDLFLTAALIQTAAGAYKPLVLRDAEEAAQAIAPRAVAPFHWWPRTRSGALALAALCAAMLWLPQLDPFGKEAQRQQKVEQRRKLDEGRQATDLRLATLKGQGDQAALSKAVLKATEDLKKTLNAMKPTDQQGNLQKLTAEQSVLSQMWRKAGERQAADSLKQDFEPQQFGEGGGSKVEQWKRQLQQGDTEAVRKQIEDLKQMAQELAKMPEGAEKRALQQKMNEAMKELSDLAASRAGNAALNAALQRAMEQLAMADSTGLSRDALQALQQSLQLSEQEMESLAQSMRDMQALEQALNTLQLAQRLNQNDPLNGGQCKNCATLSDYQQLYAQMMAQQGLGGFGRGQGQNGNGQGNGMGMGGRGQGEGNVAPEDPSARTAFESEQSRSALSAGRILLSMKAQGVSPSGEAVHDYQQYVDEVKQGASEAVIHEQVPPAYHETIRKYFDTLDVNNEQPPAK